MTIDEQLFEAFMAGFDASAEGFNGEWVNLRYRGSDGDELLRARLYPEFRAAVLGGPAVPE